MADLRLTIISPCCLCRFEAASEVILIRYKLTVCSVGLNSFQTLALVLS